LLVLIVFSRIASFEILPQDMRQTTGKRAIVIVWLIGEKRGQSVAAAQV
jgi:hypothetical protein